jgi:radical SAM superfamily enzyme YgiQ (UPF0313 family)
VARRILLIYPKFTRTSLFGFQHLAELMPGKRAVMPSLGLITFGAILDRSEWDIRLIDENVQRLHRRHLRWADVVAVSGMHMQRERLTEIVEEANALGKVTVIGGPSVSVCPEYYPMADALHVGEVGDATDALLAFLRTATHGGEPQRIFRTVEKTPLDDLPLPAIDLLDLHAYLSVPVQFSVGCPYTCEFCDIPMIYGRIARVKSAPRLVRELQAAYERGFIGTIAFADDNLIANRKAFRLVLGEIAKWQKERGYPFPLSGEATLNVARDPGILEAMREAGFHFLFVGVETPDEATLATISKKQNTQDPIVQSLRVIQSHGIETLMGIIFGFDTDTEDTGRKVTEFLRDANAPIIFFNLLAALPKTALWERLQREGRLREDDRGDVKQSADLLGGFSTNVEFKLGNEIVESMFREAVRAAYEPSEVFRRFLWNAEHVYSKQIPGRPPIHGLRQALYFAWLSSGLVFRIGRDVMLRSPYRAEFWDFCRGLRRLSREGKIRSALEVLLVATPHAHHLITWGDEVVSGKTHLDAAPRREPEANAPAKGADLIQLSKRARPANGSSIPVMPRRAEARGAGTTQ